jgi:hypothetical protein
MCVCMRAHFCLCVCMSVCTHVCVHLYGCMCVCVCLRVCACVCACACVCMWESPATPRRDVFDIYLAAYDFNLQLDAH